MVKCTDLELAPPDDPIYKGGLTIFTPASARGSTPSTKSLPKKPGTPSDDESQSEKGEK